MIKLRRFRRVVAIWLDESVEPVVVLFCACACIVIPAVIFGMYLSKIACVAWLTVSLFVTCVVFIPPKSPCDCVLKFTCRNPGLGIVKIYQTRHEQWYVDVDYSTIFLNRYRGNWDIISNKDGTKMHLNELINLFHVCGYIDKQEMTELYLLEHILENTNVLWALELPCAADKWKSQIEKAKFYRTRESPENIEDILAQLDKLQQRGSYLGVDYAAVHLFLKAYAAIGDYDGFRDSILTDRRWLRHYEIGDTHELRGKIEEAEVVAESFLKLAPQPKKRRG